MRESYSDKLIKSATTYLSRWNGADVVVRELTVSIRTLRIVLGPPASDFSRNNLVVSVPDPLWMIGPFRWSSACLTIGIVSSAESPAAKHTRKEEIFHLRDLTSGFHMWAESLEVRENVHLK